MLDPPPSRPSALHGRTRSAAALAIASTSNPSTRTLDAAFGLPLTPPTPSQARNVLVGALASFRSSSSRALQTRDGTAVEDIEAQRSPSVGKGASEEAQFSIGDEDDEESGRSRQDSQAREGPRHVTFPSTDPRLRPQKASDSSSERDHIGAPYKLDPSGGYDDNDEDEDELQYASMAEPGSEYSNLLKLEPTASTRRKSRSGLDATKLASAAGTRPHSRHAQEDSQATLCSAGDPAEEAEPVAIPFEVLSRGEKTWMWIVTSLVSALIVVALLISNDFIDWPGDGIGKD
ncbi:hypothetical protein V8E36_006103 [Tilletia maclaganii]